MAAARSRRALRDDMPPTPRAASKSTVPQAMAEIKEGVDSSIDTTGAPDTDRSDPRVVGIGASAGGLQSANQDIPRQHDAELALRRANERLELAVRGSSDGLWDWNIATGEIYWSPRFKEILGCRDEELEPSLAVWESRLHPDDRERVLGLLQASLRDGTSLESEYRLRQPGGDYVWVLARGRAQHDAQGQPTRMAGSISDITARKRAEERLREGEQRMRLAAETTGIGFWEWQVATDLIRWDNRMFQIYGVPARDGGRVTYEDWRARVVPEDLPEQERVLQTTVRGHAQSSREFRIRRLDDGAERVIQAVETVRLDASGETAWVVGTNIDVSERRRDEDELRLAASVFSNTLDGILITGPDGVILKVNRAFEQLLGYRGEEVIGQHTRLLRSDRHDTAFYASMWQSIIERGAWQGEICDRHKEGRLVPLWLSISTLYGAGGGVERYIAIMYDISEQKATQERINYLAQYDALTGLPNRTLFMDRLGHALTVARRQRRALALMFIDLDNFKRVNDSYGHPVGDELLCEVARRLRQATRASDTVARLGGDEFTILLEDAATPLAARAIAQKLLSVLAEPVALSSGQLFVSASIGIARFPEDGGDIAALLKHADLAMYRSKEAGKNQVRFYTPALSSQAEERMRLHTELCLALNSHHLEFHFQPIVDVCSRRCVGAEVLSRWRHGSRGQIPPERFIPIAEEDSLIHRLGREVLRVACNQMKDWLQSGIAPDFIAVNISGKQIAKQDFVSGVREILEMTGCPAERIVLELTESVIMREGEGGCGLMNELRALGFGIAVDDFGTGYSSLSYLKRLPVTRLKLDRSFVRDIPANGNDAAIARAILRLGETLGLQVVAEGVETEAQHQFVEAEGCALAQGYLYARAMPPATFADYLCHA